MRNIIKYGCLLLVGYLVGFKTGAKAVGKELIEAHFETTDEPLSVKGHHYEMIVAKNKAEEKVEESN